ncbi:MAG: hypothetical protein ACW97Z_10970 [Candidatus Hodarchaeales archaeon]|jgi:hypothetical protein
MALNGSFKKHGLIGIFAGGMTGILLFVAISSIYYSFLAPTEPPINPIVEDTMGSGIAKQMESKEANISYLWIYNNTWLNLNISTHYSRFIDGLLVGSLNGTFSMALLNEPSAAITPIDRSQLNHVMAEFRSSILALDNISIGVTTLDDIIPPTFLMDLAYEDGTTFSLAFSKEKMVFGFIQGIWEQTEHLIWGVQIVKFSYNLHNMQFLDIIDSNNIYDGLNSLEELIFSIFPV